MVGALVGFHRLQVAEVAHDRVLVGDAVGAEQVAAQARALERDRGVVAFQHRDMRRFGLALVFEPADLDGQQLRLGDLGDHPGQLLLHELVRGDGPVIELLANQRVPPCSLVAVHGRAEGAPAYAVAGLGEAGQRGFQTRRAGQAVRLGDAAVRKGQAGGDGGPHGPLAVDIGGRVAGRAALDQKTANPLAGARPDDGDMRGGAVRDPGLLAVQDPAVALAASVRAHAGGVRAVARLRQAEAADRLAGGQPRQPLPLLLFGAEGQDGIHDERALYRNEAAEAGIAALQLLHDEPVLHVVHAGAAVAFQVRAQEAEPAQLGDQLGGEARVAVAVADDGHQAVVDELPRGLADQQLILGEEGIDVHVVDAAEGLHTSGFTAETERRRESAEHYMV